MRLNCKKFNTTQIEEILQVPQRDLLRLCEEGIIMPEFSDPNNGDEAHQFSQRNLVEFAVALEMRKLQFSFDTVHLVISVLKKFLEEVKKGIPDYSPLHLGNKNYPRLIIRIKETETLIFSIYRTSKKSWMHRACPIPSPHIKRASIRFAVLKEGLSASQAALPKIDISKIVGQLQKRLE